MTGCGRSGLDVPGSSDDCDDSVAAFTAVPGHCGGTGKYATNTLRAQGFSGFRGLRPLIGPICPPAASTSNQWRRPPQRVLPNLRRLRSSTTALLLLLLLLSSIAAEK